MSILDEDFEESCDLKITDLTETVMVHLSEPFVIVHECHVTWFEDIIKQFPGELLINPRTIVQEFAKHLKISNLRCRKISTYENLVQLDIDERLPSMAWISIGWIRLLLNETGMDVYMAGNKKGTD